MFNVLKFLEDFHIDYRMEGKNTSEDFINICCPFCFDSGFHLGLHKYNNYAYCWKCEKHTLYDTIELLLPLEDVKKIIYEYSSSHSIILGLNTKKNIEKKEFSLPGGNLTEIHTKYLFSRKYDPDFLTKKYGLRATGPIGAYKYRIIIPFYQNGEIVTFQGRDYTGQSDIKYKACLPEYEKTHIKHILYNIDNCREDYVVLTEGCFKVFRLGDNSLSVSGKNFKIEQILHLKRYKRVFIFFDPDEAGKTASIKLQSILDNMGIDTYNIDNGLAPDDMTNDDALHFMRNLKKIF